MCECEHVFSTWLPGVIACLAAAAFEKRLPWIVFTWRFCYGNVGPYTNILHYLAYLFSSHQLTQISRIGKIPVLFLVAHPIIFYISFVDQLCSDTIDSHGLLHPHGSSYLSFPDLWCHISRCIFGYNDMKPTWSLWSSVPHYSRKPTWLADLSAGLQSATKRLIFGFTSGCISKCTLHSQTAPLNVQLNQTTLAIMVGVSPWCTPHSNIIVFPSWITVPP